ncbi:hypothetical protein RJ640_024583 [Escallonia rubra]|uniref:Uncharacterized protein n=1 Tax=Escallonia rubra TaxID=112253 RepID=A0AA88UBA5_9ASTE|nr:hypothetical protein RJ640_024583 [Escallonia rubra]
MAAIHQPPPVHPPPSLNHRHHVVRLPGQVCGFIMLDRVQTVEDSLLQIMLNYDFISAGYDMRFDIKYAYFNFLQCIHLPIQKGLKSPPCASERCLKNKKGIIASAANGNATGCCDNCEEE